MANPNLFSTTTITGKTTVANATTSISSVVSNDADSNTIYKINSIVFTNSSSSDVTVRAEIRRSLNSYYLIYDVTVPPSASLIASGRENSFYLEESDSIRVRSSSDSGVHAVISYEILG